MIYTLLGKNKTSTSMNLHRCGEKTITIRTVNECIENEEKDCYITLSESDIYDLIGVLNELKKRISKNK
jgi:hypothetical protein